MAAILETLRRARAMFANDAAPRGGPSAPTIGQIIAALDDRNVLKAVELLDPTTQGVSPERQGGTRRVKCVGCGE